MMWTYVAGRLVTGEPPAVRAAIARLADGLWGDRSRPLLDDADQRIDAIAVDAGTDEADVWLTWWTQARPGGTWVEVRLDELDRGPDPHDELVALLDTLGTTMSEPPRR
jgi:hypothetical protein